MKCPQCDKPVPADADVRWRPFCSQRCKMADLGQWFAGRYSIPSDDDPVEPPPDPESQRQ